MRAKITQSLLISVFLFAIAYTIAGVTMDTLGTRFENEKREELLYYTNTLVKTTRSAEQFALHAEYLAAGNRECGLFLYTGGSIAASAGNTDYGELAAEIALARPDSMQVYIYNNSHYLFQMGELDEGIIITVYDMSKHETALRNLRQTVLLCAMLAALLGGAVVFLMFQVERKFKSGGDSR